jgi:phosphoesterase RecJ-like protein
MYKEIYKKIKKYNNIVIVRHTGADPDALGAQVALKDIISNTFKDKRVYAAGMISSKFKPIGSTDIIPDDIYDNSLVIVLDTPISRRMDVENFDKFTDSIKIDHHPFEEKFCNIEWIDDNASSTCEMVLELCHNTKLELTKYSAERLLIGIISDTNRFLYPYATTRTMRLAADLIDEYNIDKNEIYEKVYMRDMNELRLQGYISQNMIITENNVGYICITDDIIKEFKVDAASAGNMVNNFTYVNELLVWVTFSEDVKLNTIRVSIRSRGPVINTIANQYNGGGHKYASGIRLQSFDQVDEIISKLDELCKEYKENNQ